MGTQFSSRLRSPQKRERIRHSIQSSLSSAPKKPGRRARGIELLSSAEQLKVGRLTVGSILNVAEDSDFFDLLSERPDRVAIDAKILRPGENFAGNFENDAFVLRRAVIHDPLQV